MQYPKTYNFPKIYFTNARSINNKINEIEVELKCNNIQVALITETWLNENIPSQAIEISGYTSIRKDRQGRRGGGILLYLKDNIPYTRYLNLEDDEQETVWITIRPPKLPRSVTKIAIVAVYHPPQSNHKLMNRYLSDGIDFLQTKTINCGLFIIGDFNQLPEQHLKINYKLKQAVKRPTRESAILDKCFTNMSAYYDEPEVTSHIGKSNHNAVIYKPKLSNKKYRQRS